MAALLCINAAAGGSLPVPRRCTYTYNVALTASVSARRRSLPSRGLRCTSTEVSAAEKPDAAAAAVKESEDVPFEQSLVVVGSVSDETAVSKLGFKEACTYVMYGTGAFFAGWIVSAVVSVIESMPLLPRILEIVGLGYTIWFSSRYLLFKENRDELSAKAYDLKVKIIGSDDA